MNIEVLFEMWLALCRILIGDSLKKVSLVSIINNFIILYSENRMSQFGEFKRMNSMMASFLIFCFYLEVVLLL